MGFINYGCVQRVGVDVIIDASFCNNIVNTIVKNYENIWFNEYLECVVNVKGDIYEIETIRKNRGIFYTCIRGLIGLNSQPKVYLASNNDKLLSMILDLLNNVDGIKSCRMDLPLEKGEKRVIA